MGGAGAWFCLFVCLLALKQQHNLLMEGKAVGVEGAWKGAWGRVLVKHRDDVLVTGTAQ